MGVLVRPGRVEKNRQIDNRGGHVYLAPGSNKCLYGGRGALAFTNEENKVCGVQASEGLAFLYRKT